MPGVLGLGRDLNDTCIDGRVKGHKGHDAKTGMSQAVGEGGCGPQRPWRVSAHWMTQDAAGGQRGEFLGAGGVAGFLGEEMEADGNVCFLPNV